MQPHHGFERIIEGMAEYYAVNPNRKVSLCLVGNGSETERYKEMVNRYQLKDYVHFAGEKSGADLDALYDQADIGVCSFGMYKLGIEYASSLKIPEYLAKGLPIISGSKISTLDHRDVQYCLTFPNDKSSVNIHQILEFHDKVYLGKNRAEMIQRIRNYAEEAFSEEKAFQPLFRYLEE